MSHSQHLSSEGLHIPSVSEVPGIFKPDLHGFEYWICKQEHGKEDRCCIAARDKYSDEAKNLGNDIHALMEAFIRGETFEEGVPEYQAKVFAPVAQFFKESGYKPLLINNYDNNVTATELKMTGKEFGGTLDTAGTFAKPFWEEQRKTFWAKTSELPQYFYPPKDAVWIVDLKIKSKLDALHPLQLYGYFLLLKECYGIDSQWGLIVRREKRLDKRPELQLRGYYLPAYKDIWEAAFKCWHFLND